MPARLNPGPLAGALIEGIRKRRNIGAEPEDRGTKLVLFGLPIAVFITCVVAGLKLDAAEQLIAGAALFIGAMVASFAQLASWRERLTARQRKIDGVKIRALDEAVAHVLMAILATGWMTLSLLIVVNSPYGWLDILCSSVAASTFAYLSVSLWIVVNLLWDAYRAANPVAPPLERPADGQGSDGSKAG